MPKSALRAHPPHRLEDPLHRRLRRLEVEIGVAGSEAPLDGGDGGTLTDARGRIEPVAAHVVEDHGDARMAAGDGRDALWGGGGAWWPGVKDSHQPRALAELEERVDAAIVGEEAVEVGMPLETDEDPFTGRGAVDGGLCEGLELGGGCAEGIGPQQAAQAVAMLADRFHGDCARQSLEEGEAM